MMAGSKPKANYFLAIRITDDEIKHNFDDVRKRIVQFNPNLDNICTKRDSLHLTLCLLSIPDSTQLQVAAKAMKEASDELQSLNKRTSLRLAGLCTFNGRVVYANVDCGRDLFVLRSVLLAYLDASGVCIMDQTFTPHVTVSKVTKAFECREGVSVVEPRAYEDVKDTVFGEQPVTDVCLCRMGSERQKDGFYITEASIRV